MIDIETLDSVPSAAILQIGAVAFDRYSGISEHIPVFKKNISVDSNLAFGRTISQSTLIWWFSQNHAAQNSVILSSENFTLAQVLQDFNQWYDEISFGGSIPYNVWCKGAKFDFAILYDAYRMAKIDVPWHYRRENCLRTLQNVFPEVSAKCKFKGVAHDAIDDCKNQITGLVELYKKSPKLK